LLHAPHVGLQLDQALEVLLQLLCAGVRDKNNAIGTVEHGDARSLIEHLARHGVEVKADMEALHRAQVEGEEVEKEGALALSGDRKQVPMCLLRRVVMDILQIGGLATEASAVIDDLAVNLAAGDVDESHDTLISW